MPGIESDRSPAIDSRLIATIGQGGPEAPPAVTDFMAAFRNGFITVDDLNRRHRATVNETAETKTNIAAQDLKRRQIAELGPGEIALEQRRQGLANTELGIAETTAPARQAVAAKQTQDTLDYLDPNKRTDLIAQKTREALEESYVQQFGELPPSVEVKKPGKALPFEQWLHDVQIPEIYSQAAGDFKSGYPINSKEDNQARAEFVTAQETRVKNNAREDYARYVQETENKSVPIARGTPEYYRYLSEALKAQGTKAAIQGAQLKALPGVLEAQAKGAAEGPTKLRAEVQSNRDHYLALDDVQALRKVDAAFNKIKNATTGEPSPFKDMSAIFSFMKVLDPGSTVREGEYATVENTRNIPDRFRALYNKAVNGEKLTPEQRADLVNAANSARQGQAQAASTSIKQYLAIESALGASPGDIVPVEDAAAISGAAATTPPPAGGYEALVGKQVTLKNGRTGTVVKNADGTFSLKP